MKAKFLIISFIIGTTPALSQGWESAKNKNGIQVFTRSVEGSSLKEFMGKTTIDASPEQIVSLRGYWKITPLEEGKSEVVYQAHTDPGGNIPDMAANIVVVDIPYNSLFNMKKKLK
jgi:hypothetical protein